MLKFAFILRPRSDFVSQDPDLIPQILIVAGIYVQHLPPGSRKDPRKVGPCRVKMACSLVFAGLAAKSFPCGPTASSRGSGGVRSFGCSTSSFVCLHLEDWHRRSSRLSWPFAVGCWFWAKRDHIRDKWWCCMQKFINSTKSIDLQFISIHCR